MAVCLNFYIVVVKAQLIDRNYFRDQFVLQEDGYGQVVGRIKDMIIRGGENIFPKEIEQVLEQHSEILEAQVTMYSVGSDNQHSKIWKDLIYISFSIDFFCSFFMFLSCLKMFFHGSSTYHHM